MTGSLIEYVIYCSIMSVLVVGLMHYSVVVHQRVGKHQRSLHSMLQAAGVQSALTRDIWQAPGSDHTFYTSLGNDIIWHTDEVDIGWCLQGTDLYRIMGTYDTRRHQWTTSRKGLVAKNVIMFKIAQGQGRSICCTLKIADGKQVAWQATPRSVGVYG